MDSPLTFNFLTSYFLTYSWLVDLKYFFCEKYNNISIDLLALYFYWIVFVKRYSHKNPSLVSL